MTSKYETEISSIKSGNSACFDTLKCNTCNTEKMKRKKEVKWKTEKISLKHKENMKN